MSIIGTTISLYIVTIYRVSLTQDITMVLTKVRTKCLQ